MRNKRVPTLTVAVVTIARRWRSPRCDWSESRGMCETCVTPRGVPYLCPIAEQNQRARDALANNEANPETSL